MHFCGDGRGGRRGLGSAAALRSQVVYAVRNELCRTPSDFLARRSRLAFLDTAAARRVRDGANPVAHALHDGSPQQASYHVHCDAAPKCMRAQALPHVVELMGDELRWGGRARRQEQRRAENFLRTFEVDTGGGRGKQA